jgi:hypothetical protein
LATPNYIIGDVCAHEAHARFQRPAPVRLTPHSGENAAIGRGRTRDVDARQHAHMKGQRSGSGISYAWTREIATCLRLL